MQGAGTGRRIQHVLHRQDGKVSESPRQVDLRVVPVPLHPTEHKFTALTPQVECGGPAGGAIVPPG